MSGVKGKSGRKSHYRELDIMEVVNLSIKTIRDYLKDPSIDLHRRAQLAHAFALKRIPEKHQHEITHELNELEQAILTKLQNDSREVIDVKHETMTDIDVSRCALGDYNNEKDRDIGF